MLKIEMFENCIFTRKWTYDTVWKFQTFPAIQILREINFGESKNAKNCHFNNFRGSQIRNIAKMKVQSLENCQNDSS